MVLVKFLVAVVEELSALDALPAGDVGSAASEQASPGLEPAACSRQSIPASRGRGSRLPRRLG
jgi:hypothetical protein